MRQLDDFLREFELEHESMDYLDGPVSGWMRCKETGTWYAFDCQPIVPDLMWHWTLIPAPDKPDLRSVLERSRNDTSGYWVSALEDRRDGLPGNWTVVKIPCSVARPVILSLLLRDPQE